MNRLTTQQKWFLIIAVIVIINVAVWLYGLTPARDEVGELRTQINQLEDEIDVNSELLRQYADLDTEVLQAEMDELDAIVPSQGLLREFLAEIEETANDLGILLTNVRAASPRDREPYRALDMAFELSGTYGQVSGYLNYLENNPRLVVVRSFILGSSDEAGATMRFSVDITIYAENFSDYTPYLAPGRDNPFE